MSNKSGGSITIGRSVENDLVIPLDTVSSRHARLEKIGDRYILSDLGSTNGTALNDPLNKITRSEVSRKDYVFLGTHRIAVSDLLARLASGAAAPPAPPVPPPRPRDDDDWEAVLDETIPQSTFQPAALTRSRFDSSPLPPWQRPEFRWLAAGAGIVLILLAVFLAGRGLRGTAATRELPKDGAGGRAVDEKPKDLGDENGGDNPATKEPGRAPPVEDKPPVAPRPGTVAVVCIPNPKKAEGQELLPMATAWAVAPRQFVTHATLILSWQHKEPEIPITLVTENDTLSVNRVNFHPGFPAQELAEIWREKNKKVDDALALRIAESDLALLTTDKGAAVPFAWRNTNFRAVGDAGLKVQAISFDAGLTEPKGFHPIRLKREGRLDRLAPGMPSLRLARLADIVLNQIDGSPIVGSDDQVIGTVAALPKADGEMDPQAIYVIAAERVAAFQLETGR